LFRFPYKGDRVSFAGVKRPGRGVDNPFPSSAEDKEREELHLCALIACSRMNITFDVTLLDSPLLIEPKGQDVSESEYHIETFSGFFRTCGEGKLPA